ncbi:hypothetical protein RND81_05G033000 [Saponaria officinalis]|uniref:Uncharacterized protein n=1 Tax=Saponaria officinalis TaxID=3572 RepID=A0AAW1KUF1_SAPOF
MGAFFVSCGLNVIQLRGILDVGVHRAFLRKFVLNILMCCRICCLDHVVMVIDFFFNVLFAFTSVHLCLIVTITYSEKFCDYPSINLADMSRWLMKWISVTNHGCVNNQGKFGLP